MTENEGAKASTGSSGGVRARAEAMTEKPPVAQEHTIGVDEWLAGVPGSHRYAIAAFRGFCVRTMAKGVKKTPAAWVVAFQAFGRKPVV